MLIDTVEPIDDRSARQFSQPILEDAQVSSKKQKQTLVHFLAVFMYKHSKNHSKQFLNVFFSSNQTFRSQHLMINF